jgi:hypothetical protein
VGDVAARDRLAGELGTGRVGPPRVNQRGRTKKEVPLQDRGRDSGRIPGSDMAQRDAAGVNGSDRKTSHGASHPRVMPNGCLGSPELVLPRR